MDSLSFFLQITFQSHYVKGTRVLSPNVFQMLLKSETLVYNPVELLYRFKYCVGTKKSVVRPQCVVCPQSDEDMTWLSDNVVLHHTILAIQHPCGQGREGHLWTERPWKLISGPIKRFPGLKTSHIWTGWLIKAARQSSLHECLLNNMFEIFLGRTTRSWGSKTPWCWPWGTSWTAWKSDW